MDQVVRLTFNVTDAIGVDVCTVRFNLEGGNVAARYVCVQWLPGKGRRHIVCQGEGERVCMDLLSWTSKRTIASSHSLPPSCAGDAVLDRRPEPVSAGCPL